MLDSVGPVFITGGSRGIGRLVGVHLATEGVPVAVIARPSDDLYSLGSEAGEAKVAAIPDDVADPASVSIAFTAATQTLGAPAALFTFAGSIDALGPLSTVDPELWWSAIAVDLRGTMLAVQAALGSMIPSGAGRIITVYGNLGDRGAPNLSAFAASKAAVARLAETLGAELAGTGVVALCLHRGSCAHP